MDRNSRISISRILRISKVSPIHLDGFPGLCIMLLSWAPDLERFLPQHHYPNHWVWLTTFSGFQLHVLEVMAQSPAHTSSFLFILASFPCLTVLIPCFPHTGCKAFALKTGSVSFSFFKILFIAPLIPPMYALYLMFKRLTE